MGCDIHMYKEKFVGGKWVTADEWVAYDYGDDEKGIEVPFEKRFTERNYELFGLLSSGVRREHPFSFVSRGLPFDCCAEAVAQRDHWDGDGHSHSYLYLHELQAMQRHLETAMVRISGMKHSGELSELRASIATGSPNWHLLFPYCQMTNAPNHEDFEMDVPASFYMGEDLARVIAGFDGVDGDNHRIVFWFDN